MSRCRPLRHKRVNDEGGAAVAAGKVKFNSLRDGAGARGGGKCNSANGRGRRGRRAKELHKKGGFGSKKTF